MALSTVTDSVPSTGLVLDKKGSYNKTGSESIINGGAIDSQIPVRMAYIVSRTAALDAAARVDGHVQIVLEDNEGVKVVDKLLPLNSGFDAGGMFYRIRLTIKQNATTDGLTISTDTDSDWEGEYLGSPADFEESQGSQKPKLTVTRTGYTQNVENESVSMFHFSDSFFPSNEINTVLVGSLQNAGGKVTVEMELEITA